MCDENNLKMVSKGIKMEHTTKTGFILGLNTRLSDTNACIKERNKKMKFEEGIVETNNKFTHEKEARSKLLSIHVVSSHSKKIDEILT